MITETKQGAHDRDTIFRSLVTIIDSMTRDWDMEYEEGPHPGTRFIGDLGFESIDIVQLVVAIEEHFQRRDLPFEELLMGDGRYVDELRISEVVDFLIRHLNSA